MVRESSGASRLAGVQEAAARARDFLESYSRAPATDYRRQVGLYNLYFFLLGTAHLIFGME